MAAVYVERRRFVAKTLSERPWCEARFDGCTGRSESVNELIRRSHNGARYPGEPNRRENVYHSLCNRCHDAITVNSLWAKENGWEQT